MNKLSYDLTQSDNLRVLSSTREVVARAKSVHIESTRLNKLTHYLIHQEPVQQQARLALPEWPTQYHFFDGTQRTVNWILLLDALNFCFWAEKDQARWQISYRDELLNGYWAEAAALRRGIE